MNINKLHIAMLTQLSCKFSDIDTHATGIPCTQVSDGAGMNAEHGHRVDIYSLNNNHPQTQTHAVVQLHENVRLIHLSINGYGHIAKDALYPLLEDLFEALDAYIATEGLHYDIVHSHYWLSGRLGRWAQDRWNRPHFVMFHTLGAVKNMTGVGDPEPEIRIDNERHLIDACHRILVATEKEKNFLVKHYDALPDKIGVVPCGVNLDLFQPMDKLSARRKLGFDPNDSIILYVGRFDPMKGIERLLEAIPHLSSTHTRLVIIGGDGPDSNETQRLKQLSQDKGIQDSVTFIGRIPQADLPPYYNAADVLVVPSYYESFGLVGLESLACGTPVVSTRVGVLESILDGLNGKIVSNGCPEALAESIALFVSNDGDHSIVRSAKAIRTTVEPYSWANVANLIVKEYSAARHLTDHS